MPAIFSNNSLSITEYARIVVEILTEYETIATLRSCGFIAQLDQNLGENGMCKVCVLNKHTLV